MLMCLSSPIAHRKPAHRAATMRSSFIFALLLCSCISCSAQAYRDLTRTKALSIRDSDALAASDAALPAGSTLQLALVVFRCAQHGEGRMSGVACCCCCSPGGGELAEGSAGQGIIGRQHGTLAYGVHVSTGALHQSCGMQMQLLEQRLGQTPLSMDRLWATLQPPCGKSVKGSMRKPQQQ